MTQNCVIFLISSLYPFFSGPHSLPDDQNGHCCLLLPNIKIILFVSLSPTHSKAGAFGIEKASNGTEMMWQYTEGGPT